MQYERMTHAELEREVAARRICRMNVPMDRELMVMLLRSRDRAEDRAAERAAFWQGYDRAGSPEELLPRLLSQPPARVAYTMGPVWWEYYALDSQRVMRYLQGELARA